MKIAFNPSTVAALIAPPNNKDITFDLRGHNIFARGVKFCGTDTNTWRDIKINNVSIDSNILDLRDGDNTTLTNTNGVVTINSTWRPVVDNLTSDSTTSSLSANLGRVLKSLIDGKSDSGHTHDDRYLKLTGGTMAGNALITFADSGSWGTDKGPQGARGGLYWTGQSDYAKLYAEETAGDNLDLVIQFGDDNSNGLSIRNNANTQTSYISSSGVITTGTFKGNLDWSYITNKPSSFTPSAHTHSWTSITDKLVVNEFNIVNAGYNDKLWFNYLPINDRSKTASIQTYIMCNGAKGMASVTASGFIKNGSSNSYVLLGDGGHQTISSLSVNYAESAGYANGIANKGLLDSQEKIDNFITANRFEYAIFKTAESNNVGFESNDGMILSIPWDSTRYGAQIAFDDALSATVKVRSKSENWGSWYTLLHSGNYNSYSPTLTGTGASGTWNINITGNADTVDGQHFSYSNSSNSPTYLWVTNSNGSSFLAARESISVNYANSAGTANVLLTNNTSQAADACYSENPGLRFWRYNGTSSTSGQRGGDGWIMSWSWNSGSVGGQIYVDDNPSKIMCIRGRNNDVNKTFTTWSTILHSDNYTSYCAAASHTHPYLPLSGGTMTGTIYFNNMQSGKDAGIDCTLGSRRMLFGIGTSGNAGIWELNKGWIMGMDTSNNVFIHGNADSATKSEYSRSLLGRSTSGNDYDTNSANLVFAEWNTMSDNRWYLKATGYECRVAYANNASKVYGQVGDTGSHELVRCDMNNDQFRIIAGSNGNNNGWAEIATADDGNEPIYVRQYTGVFNTVVRTLTLLDANGYTHFPSYINIGGNENNNSSPDRVWGSNGSDSYLRSYRTSALRVSYADYSNSTKKLTSLGDYTYDNLSTDIPTNAVSYKIITSGGTDLGDSQYNVLHIPWSSGDWGIYLLFGANNGRFGVKYKHSGIVREVLDSSNYTSYAIPTSASCNKNWSYSGQSGQPTWLWGTNDGTNCYVWNPSNFSVNYANSANTSNRTKFLETFRQDSTTDTYGASYPIWAQWANSTNVRLKCTNYTVWTDKADYATSAGNTDTVDGYHASGLLTSVTNTNNGISITVGGTTKSVANISVAYASSAGNADTVDGAHLIKNGSGSGIKQVYYFSTTGSNSSYIKLGTLPTVSVTSYGSSKVMFTVRGGINYGGTNESVYEVAASTRGSIQVTSTLVRGNRELKFGYVSTSSNVEIWMAYDGSYRGVTEVEVSSSVDFTLAMTETTTKPSGFVEGSYRILAATTDNVASATKLQTPRTIWGHSFDGTADVNGTIYINNSDSSNGAIRLNNNVNSNARISAINDQVIFNTGNAIRFGETSWDWNQWAGLKYTHSNKTIYLGIADGSVFNANSTLGGGTLNLRAGISNIDLNSGTSIIGRPTNGSPYSSRVTLNDTSIYLSAYGGISMSTGPGTIELSSGYGGIELSCLGNNASISPEGFKVEASRGAYLNSGNSGNVYLCLGGGNVGIGTATPLYELDVMGNTFTAGFGIRPYYLSDSRLLPTISPGDGYTYRCLEIGKSVAVSCIIADRVVLSNERGVLIKFNTGYDGLIVLLKDLQDYGNGNGYFWVMPSGCAIIRPDGSSTLISYNLISNAYDDGKSRFFVYSSKYNRWIEFYCG